MLIESRNFCFVYKIFCPENSFEISFCLHAFDMCSLFSSVSSFFYSSFLFIGEFFLSCFVELLG